MANIDHLLTYFPMSDEHLARLHTLLPDTVITQRTCTELTQADVAAADVIFGNIPPSMLDHAPNLKWMHLSSAGTDGYMHLMDRGILLTNGTGAYNDSIAEFMLALTSALCIRLPGYTRNQQQGIWKRLSWAKTIMDSTVVVLGCGNIGTAYAKRMHDLGAYVIGVRRSASACPEGVDEMVSMEQADEVLPRADIVAMIMPNTPETAGFMDSRRIGLMKDGALLINCGRGNALDPDALYDALVSGKLDSAAIDVAYLEPLPAEDRLWTAPNLIITPHIAGGWRPGGEASPHMAQTVVKVFLQNLEAYLSDTELPNTVDTATGYTKKHR
ncbi:MAG: D-2-hydroxyacid dehydrogenase [Oscillospiraceae bacterium]|nr:D-2-hydroxyacid dehydrogenase [Oscillospiraceae bacterium]